MPPSRKRDVALEPRFADLDVAGRGGEHPAAVDQERLGRVGPDRNLARDGDVGAVEDALADLDAMRVLGVEAGAVAEVEQPGFEPPLLFGKRAAAGR